MSKYNISQNTKRYRLNHFTQSVPILLLCLIVFGFLARASFTAYLEKKRSDSGAMTAEAELAELKARQAFVTEELKKLSTAEGREAKLREKFGVGRPGEQVAIIVEGANNENDLIDGPHFWARIKNFFSALFQK